MNPSPPETTQRGAATLLTALALILALSGLALAVSHTAVLEQHMTSKQHRKQEALAAAEAAAESGLASLLGDGPRWLPADEGLELALPATPLPTLRSSDGSRFGINLVLSRHPLRPGFVRLHASAEARRAEDIAARVRFSARLYSVLSATGERAPPLLIDGCIPPGGPAVDVFPQAEDAEAVVLSGGDRCVPADRFRLHGGRVHTLAFPGGSLWPRIFGVTRAQFRKLAEMEAASSLPLHERRHLWVRTSDLSGGRWSLSLGRPEQPVVIVFPESTGCVALAEGTEIHGVLYMEADCTGAPAWGSVRIHGTLAVTGTLPVLGRYSRIAHIRHARGRPDRLFLPTIAVIPVPGSWNDL